MNAPDIFGPVAPLVGGLLMGKFNGDVFMGKEFIDCCGVGPDRGGTLLGELTERPD